jgi:hypothetical protein
MLPLKLRTPLTEIYFTNISNSGAGKLLELAKPVNDALRSLCESYEYDPVAALKQEPKDAKAHLMLSLAADAAIIKFGKEAEALYREDLAGSKSDSIFSGQALGAIDCLCMDGARKNILPLIVIAAVSPASVSRMDATQVIGSELQDLWVQANIMREAGTLGSAEGCMLLTELIQLHKAYGNLAKLESSHLRPNHLPAIVRVRHDEVWAMKIPDMEKGLKNMQTAL